MAGSSLGGTFRLILVKHVETAMYKNKMYVMDADCQRDGSLFLYLFILFGRCRIRKASPMGLQIKNVYKRGKHGAGTAAGNKTQN